ncbi:MAG: hypothetical protein V3R77_00505 [Candidatus Binatia bacterium]
MSGRASRRTIRAILVLATLAVIAGSALLALGPALETERGRDLVGALVLQLTGYELRSAALEVVGGRALSIRGLVLAAPGAGTLLEARRARVGILAGGLFDGRPFDVELEDFSVDLAVLHDRRESRSGDSRRAPDDQTPGVPPLGRLRAVDGTVRWRGRDGPASILIEEVVLDREAGSTMLVTQGRVRLAQGAGRLVWSGGYDPASGAVELDLDGDWPVLASAAATLGSELPDLGGVLGMSVRGRLRGSLRSEARADLDAALIGDAPLAGASATLHMTRSSDTGSARARAEVHVGHGIPQLVATAVVPGDAASPIEVSLSWQQVPLAELAARAAPWLKFERVEGRGTLTLRAVSGRSELDVKADVSVEDLVMETADVRIEAAGEATVDYDGERVGFGERGLNFSRLELRSAGATVRAGDVTILGHVRPARAERQVVVRSLVVGQLAASNSTWTRAVEAGELGGEGSLAFAAGDEPHLLARLEMRAGEVLWDRMYAGLESLRPVLELEVRHMDGGFAVERFDGAIEGVGTFDSHFVYRHEGGLESGTIDLEVPGLGRAFDILVREPLAESWPTMAGSSLEGLLTGALEYTAEPEGARLEGRIALFEGALDIDNGRSAIAGLQLSLPVNLSTNGRSYGGSQTGRLVIGSMRLRGADIPEVTLPLRTRTNEIAATASVTVELFGGRVSFGDLRARGLTTPQRHVSMWLSARGIDLAELTGATGLPSAEGVLDATFSSLRASAGELVADGRMRLGLLGGQVELTGLRVTDIGTRIPRIHADIEGRGIDLGEATGALGVGRIEGIVDGRIEGLQLVDGQPVSFDAELASVPTRGVKQRISVTAIEQLSILGGAGASPVTAAVLGFFDEYRYAKMGARCSLRNDRFLLRGIERYEEREFLVVGTFMPPTVNVVSHNQVIAFNEMVRRLARIAEAAGASDGTHNPVLEEQ